ncbi:MAG: DsrE/DsrF/DrsH-like family protein [Lentimicrobium sp.]
MRLTKKSEDMEKEEFPLKKVCIICSKGTIESIYPALILANGALMEGIQAKLFFTFFGLDAVTKKFIKKIHTPVVGNPSLRLPGNIPFPTLLGILPGMEALATSMMKSQMEKLDIPTIPEFMEYIVAGGGEIFACKLAMDMFGLKKEDLIDDVKDILTVGEFYALCGGQGTQILFI